MSMTITAGGRTIGFRFDVQAWLCVEEAFGSLEAMTRRMDGGEKPMEASLTLAAIEANAYERHTGGTPDITAEWLRENLTPRSASLACSYAKVALVEGMKRGSAEDGDEDVDVVAEELQKKTGA